METQDLESNGKVGKLRESQAVFHFAGSQEQWAGWRTCGRLVFWCSAVFACGIWALELMSMSGQRPTQCRHPSSLGHLCFEFGAYNANCLHRIAQTDFGVSLPIFAPWILGGLLTTTELHEQQRKHSDDLKQVQIYIVWAVCTLQSCDVLWCLVLSFDVLCILRRAVAVKFEKLRHCAPDEVCDWSTGRKRWSPAKQSEGP